MNKIFYNLYGVITAISFATYISIFDIVNLSSVISLLYIGVNLLLFSWLIKKKFQSKVITLFFSISFFSIYVVFNNSMNGIPFMSGVYWWFVLSFLILLKHEFVNYKFEGLAFLVLSGAMLTIDAYYRFFISTINFNRETFYSYKYGIIGQDSNFAGIFCIVCVSLTLLLNKKQVISNRLTYLLTLLFFILTLSTFSRAAIIAVFILLMFYYLNRLILILCISVLPFLFVSIFSYIMSEPSGATKFDLVSRGLDLYLSYDYFDAFFGVGLGNARIGNLTPHILPLQILLDLGLVGIFLYASIWFCFYWVVGKDSLLLIVPYMLVSFSISPLGIGVIVYCMWFFIKLNDRSVTSIKH